MDINDYGLPNSVFDYLMQKGRNKGRGVIIKLIWNSSAFWPILTEDGEDFRDCVQYLIEITNTVDGFEKGKSPYFTVFADRYLEFKVMAFTINFEGHVKYHSVVHQAKLVCRLVFSFMDVVMSGLVLNLFHVW